MKKTFSMILVACTLFSMISLCSLTANAANGSVTATVVDGSSYNIPAADKLNILCDGNSALEAATRNDVGLIGFENTGFNHEDGISAAVESTIELTLDLGKVKHVGGTSVSFFKDTNSMIDLPVAIVFEGSTDGDCWFDLNASNKIKIPSEVGENTVTTISCDFSKKAVFDIRYIKAIITIKSGWFFASEFSADIIKEPVEGANRNPSGPYAFMYDETPLGVGVITPNKATEIDLASNEEFKTKSAQIIKAKKDVDNKYVITFNKVNAWPNGHTGVIQLAEDEILIVINTTGSLESDLESVPKWAVRGLTPDAEDDGKGSGDFLFIEDDNIYFYPAEHVGGIVVIPVEPDEPIDLDISGITSEDESKISEESADSNKNELDLDTIVLIIIFVVLAIFIIMIVFAMKKTYSKR